MQTGRHANGHPACGPSGRACRSTYGQTCSRADRLASMLPVMRAAIARMCHGLPNKHRAANPIRQGIPNAGSPKPDRPLALTTSRNRPAPGASSNEGDRDSGAQSNRAGWLGKVWKGRSARSHRRALPCRCASHRRGWPSAGGNPQEDRTQISKPQVKSLQKCALSGAAFPQGSNFRFSMLPLQVAGLGPELPVSAPDYCAVGPSKADIRQGIVGERHK